MERSLRNDVTVNLNIRFSAPALCVLGSTRGYLDYSDYRDALIASASGAVDRAIIAHLSPNRCLSVYMNGTTSNPNGVNSATPWVDNNCNDNNNTIALTWANARVLGLTAAHDSKVDGSVSFSSTFNWDFNPDDGVNANAFDFIGVATHEIGHALGFISRVYILDGNFKGYTDAVLTYTFYPFNCPRTRSIALRTCFGAVPPT